MVPNRAGGTAFAGATLALWVRCEYATLAVKLTSVAAIASGRKDHHGDGALGL